MHFAHFKLTFCNMRTLYLRNVPDEVVERLERLAEREGMSVSAFACRELSSASKRADNSALLARLPNLSVSSDSVVEALETSRTER